MLDMATGAGSRRVGVVTFNGEVTIIGDGTKDPVTIAGDKLQNFDFLVENGTKESALRMTKKIEETKEVLV
jgi:hypothetical protein